MIRDEDSNCIYAYINLKTVAVVHIGKSCVNVLLFSASIRPKVENWELKSINIFILINFNSQFNICIIIRMTKLRRMI
jgi:hypothetical protein